MENLAQGWLSGSSGDGMRSSRLSDFLEAAPEKDSQTERSRGRDSTSSQITSNGSINQVTESRTVHNGQDRHRADPCGRYESHDHSNERTTRRDNSRDGRRSYRDSGRDYHEDSRERRSDRHHREDSRERRSDRHHREDSRERRSDRNHREDSRERRSGRHHREDSRDQKKIRLSGHNDKLLNEHPIKKPKVNSSPSGAEIKTDDFDTDSTELPILPFRTQIMEAIHTNPVTILIGETGSGKSTQLPQFLLQDRDLLPQSQLVAITQPRRLAAISIAQRVASELGEKVGERVGYSVRFDECWTPGVSKARFLTEGVLIRECLRDASLSKYSVIMLDEAHERSLDMDILLGLLRRALEQRPRGDLRLLIASATLDEDKFRQYFGGNCPVLHVPGRTFPVDLYHSRHLNISAEEPSTSVYISEMVETVLRINAKDSTEGHILVFLTGREDIEAMASQLRTRMEADPLPDRELLILPLYASLSPTEQSRVFLKPTKLLFAAAGGKSSPAVRTYLAGGAKARTVIFRKVILSTNLAETSITVPHIKYVVDCGYMKQKIFDPDRQVESLIVTPISQASALQRAGRAGRMSAGQCFRMYSKISFENFKPDTVPEILRSNLSSTVLYLKCMGISDVSGFEFLDAPDESRLNAALLELYSLGAIDSKGVITMIGRKMSSFPLEPRVARALIESYRHGCVDDMIRLCSMMCAENVWWQPRAIGNRALDSGGRGRTTHPRHLSPEDERVEIAHAALRHPYGDFHSLWKVFCEWEKVQFSVSWCERNYLSVRAMRMAKDSFTHLTRDVEKARLSDVFPTINTDFSASIEKRLSASLVAGFYTNAAMRCTNDSVYKLLSPDPANAHDITLVHIHPQSALRHHAPSEYLIYQELVSGSQLYIRQVGKASFRVLQEFQKAWRRVPTSELNGQKPKPVITKETSVSHNTGLSTDMDKSVSVTSTNPSTDQDDTTRKSVIEAAKQRFLLRNKSV